jgi:hypothetical protein
MALLGQAAVAIWSDMQDPAAHDHWHSHEHLLERLGIPGFLRARRMVALEVVEVLEMTAPRYFVLYEVANAEVMTSPAYLHCLNQPSPWTTRTMAANRSLHRTLCSVRSSHGHGVGGHMLVLPVAPLPGQEDQLRDWLKGEVLPSLAAQAGLVGAHYLERDNTHERPATEEERLRGRPDGSVPALLLVEGYAPEVLRQVLHTLLGESGLSAHGGGAQSTLPGQIYTLAHQMTPADL